MEIDGQPVSSEDVSVGFCMPAIPGPSSKGAEKPARHATSAFIASNGGPGQAGTALQGQDQGRDLPTVRETAPEPAVASASPNTSCACEGARPPVARRPYAHRISGRHNKRDWIVESVAPLDFSAHLASTSA